MKKTPSTSSATYAARIADIDDLLAKTKPDTALHAQLTKMRADAVRKFNLAKG